MSSPHHPPDAGPLGLLGGTFDPVHFGHLRLAEEALEELGLARVSWIPAARPPHRDAPGAEAAHRLAMVRLALAGEPRFAADAREIEREAATGLPSYMADTLSDLRAELDAEPDARTGKTRPLVLILGTDAFAGLESWHRWRDIPDLCHLAVAARPGHALAPETLTPGLRDLWRNAAGSAADLRGSPAGRIVTFPCTALDISATVIRARIKAGRSVRYLLPDAVLDYIETHHLY